MQITYQSVAVFAKNNNLEFSDSELKNLDEKMSEISDGLGSLTGTRPLFPNSYEKTYPVGLLDEVFTEEGLIKPGDPLKFDMYEDVEINDNIEIENISYHVYKEKPESNGFLFELGLYGVSLTSFISEENFYQKEFKFSHAFGQNELMSLALEKAMEMNHEGLRDVTTYVCNNLKQDAFESKGG